MAIPVSVGPVPAIGISGIRGVGVGPDATAAGALVIIGVFVATTQVQFV
jgi:hypothetical protein